MNHSMKKKMLLLAAFAMVFSVAALPVSANYYVSYDNDTIDAYPYGMNYTTSMEIKRDVTGSFASVTQIGIKRTIYRNGSKVTSSTQYDKTSPFNISIDESFDSSSRSNSWKVDVQDLLKGKMTDGTSVNGAIMSFSLSDSN